jgi:hypothetical protein
MQAEKSAGRAIDEGVEVKQFYIGNKNSFVLDKETLGIHTEFFDPVEILLLNGYPPERLHLITILREPAATFASWERMWGSADDNNLIKSFKIVQHINKFYKSSGIHTLSYVHEAIRDNDPGVVIKKLIRKISYGQISYSPQAVDWTQGPKFGDIGSNIIFYDNPPEKFIHGVREGLGYGFYESGTKSVTINELRLKQNGLYDIYNEIKACCEADLDIKV